MKITISFPVLLFLVFLVLKLTNVIAWSWIWVLSPLWISLGLYIMVLIVLGLVVTIISKVK